MDTELERMCKEATVV